MCEPYIMIESSMLALAGVKQKCYACRPIKTAEAPKYTANHGNMYVHFRFVTSLRRYAESYLLVHKALIIVHVV